MATHTQLATEPKSGAVVEQKIQKLRQLYADAPELGRVALEKGLPALRLELAAATGTQNAGRIGARTLHDMRFVFLDNDTKLLFATAYDGEWDAYIDDFVTKIPNSMDLLFCNIEGWPGIHSPSVKDFIAKHQIAAEAWYVANPDLTVTETRRLERVGNAVEELLDKLG